MMIFEKCSNTLNFFNLRGDSSTFEKVHAHLAPHRGVPMAAVSKALKGTFGGSLPFRFLLLLETTW